jgi:glyoxylase-like metal-dependent hydrolase (beta-lactamase superfamily II)
VREVRQGVWHWQAPHPEWNARGAAWGKVVSSYALEVGDRLLLFDPLAVPTEIEEATAGRETVMVLTCPWHRRDAPRLAERHGWPIYVPPPDPPDPDPVKGEVFHAGDRLPIGVEAFPGREANDPVLWIESRRALVAGDTLIERDKGLEFPRDWAPDDASPQEIFESLQALLDLPVELVLPTHGAPTDRAALERALS